MIPLKDDTPTDRAPVLTVLLLALNMAAFLWQVGAHEWAAVSAAGGDVLGFAMERLADSVQRGGVIPYEILRFEDVYARALVPPPLTIFTSMFLHGDLLHLASNLLFLWIFGNNVEDALGRTRFVLFYLACGVAAALLQVVTSAGRGQPDILVPMVGASGAIAGVLAAYLVLYPHARVTTLLVIVIFVRILPVPARFFIGVWFALQLLSVAIGRNTGVAFFAHIGGFVAGWILVRLVGRRPRWRARRVVF